MKEFLKDYIEEILFFTALLFMCASAYFIGIASGLFITGVVLIIAQDKIVKIKKILGKNEVRR